MKFKPLLIAVAVAVLLSLSTSPVSAQDTALFSNYLKGDTAQIAFNHATQAGDAALLIRYNASTLATTKPSGTLQVTTTTLLFKTGLAGAEVADTSVKCPSGGTGGTIDLTDASCDTIGEVVDIINASSGDHWKAVNWAALRTDGVNDKFVAAAAASANTTSGIQVVWDTSKTLFAGGVLAPAPSIDSSGRVLQTIGIRNFLDPSGNLYPQPSYFTLKRAVLLYANVMQTGTTPDFKIYCVAPIFSDAGSSETVTQIYQQRLTSATVTAVNFSPVGLLGCKGQKFLIRTVSSATATTPYLFAHGSVFPM